MGTSRYLFRPHQPVTAGLAIAVVLFLCSPVAQSEAASNEKPPAAASVYAKWHNGPGQDTYSFPIAVWLQDPRNAPEYQALGVNLYVALWKGPTAEQIAELKRHGMPVICDQNDYALNHLGEKTIVGWMHGDEPDNAQSLPNGKGYGPPIPPEKILHDYQKIRGHDPRRPVMLNLGQGVAWDGWYGRGVRTNHPEDYAEYVRGGDIISFDIYPAVHDKPAIAGKLWYVAGRRATEGLGGQADRVGLHRMYADQQREDQAHAAAGEGRGMDVDHSRLAGAHLFLPPVSAPLHRGGPSGRQGDGPCRGGDQPRGPGPGGGHQ